jgi:hypothetical protein
MEAEQRVGSTEDGVDGIDQQSLADLGWLAPATAPPGGDVVGRRRSGGVSSDLLKGLSVSLLGRARRISRIDLKINSPGSCPLQRIGYNLFKRDGWHWSEHHEVCWLD